MIRSRGPVYISLRSKKRSCRDVPKRRGLLALYHISGGAVEDYLERPVAVTPTGAAPLTRGLHSSTFQLNLSRFLSLNPPTDTEYPSKLAYVEPKSGPV